MTTKPSNWHGSFATLACVVLHLGAFWLLARTGVSAPTTRDAARMEVLLVSPSRPAAPEAKPPAIPSPTRSERRPETAPQRQSRMAALPAPAAVDVPVVTEATAPVPLASWRAGPLADADAAPQAAVGAGPDTGDLAASRLPGVPPPHAMPVAFRHQVTPEDIVKGVGSLFGADHSSPCPKIRQRIASARSREEVEHELIRLRNRCPGE